MHHENGVLLPKRECCSGEESCSYNCHQPEDDCVENPVDDSSAHISQRSVCPWKYDVTNDDNRYPQTLAEAVCCWEKCHEANESSHVCSPVRYLVPVLYVADEPNSEGNCVYTRKLEAVTGGCTCAAIPSIVVKDEDI